MGYDDVWDPPESWVSVDQYLPDENETVLVCAQIWKTDIRVYGFARNDEHCKWQDVVLWIPPESKEKKRKVRINYWRRLPVMPEAKEWNT